MIVGEGTVVPADCKVICDYSDPGGFESFNRMQAEGVFEDSSSEEDKGKEKAEGEKMSDGDVDKEKNGTNSGKKSEGAQSSDDDDDDDEKANRKGYPILACDHSAISGESHAVDRYMGDPVYYTTHCKRGKAYTVVQTSAKTSFVGRTASMVAGTSGKGHFEIVMDRIGTSLLVLVMAWILAAWIGGFWRHIPIASPGKQTLLDYTLVLLIIGVPVGLPVVTTTTMAVGAAYLARRKAIVQKLTAIESLAVGF